MPVKTEEDVGEDSNTHMTNGGGKTLASGETGNTAGSGHRKSKVGWTQHLSLAVYLIQ